MARFFRRVGHDLRRLHHIEAYAIALIAFVFAILSVIGDILPVNARWTVLLVGVSVLVFRVTLPEHADGSAEDVLKDRTAFDDQPFSASLRGASEVWVFAPSAINLLTPQICDTIRTTILAKAEGVVRVVVLDPGAEAAIEFATRQLDDSLDYPSTQLFRSSLDATVQRLQRMATWHEPGSFSYRLAGYNPGFSLVAVNPGDRHGALIVEFHGWHNQVTNTRMHIELTRATSDQWYSYWLGQFDRIWQAAQEPAPSEPTARKPAASSPAAGRPAVSEPEGASPAGPG
jgi:hypothetical protein